MVGLGRYTVFKQYHYSGDIVNSLSETNHDDFGEFIAGQVGYDFYITPMFSIGAFYRGSYSKGIYDAYLNSSVNIKLSLLLR